MKKIIFLGVGETCERAHFAKEHFDLLEEMGVRFMMSVHGCGRWPSSKVPVSMCESMLHEVKDTCLKDVDKIVVMEDDEKFMANNPEFMDKMEHWNIHGFSRKEIKKKVSDLVDKMEH
jgi:hypothetical protein